jgi:hypothetical protein
MRRTVVEIPLSSAQNPVPSSKASSTFAAFSNSDITVHTFLHLSLGLPFLLVPSDFLSDVLLVILLLL